MTEYFIISTEKELDILFQKVENLLIQDRIVEVSNSLLNILKYLETHEPVSMRKNLVINSARIYSIKNKIINGTISNVEADIELNKIRSFLFDTLYVFKERCEQMIALNINVKLDNSFFSKWKIKQELQDTNSDILLQNDIINVEIHLNINYEDFNEDKQNKFLSRLKSTLNIKDIRIIKIRKGSTIIELEIPKRKYRNLLDSFQNGKFDEFNPLEINEEESQVLKVLKYTLYEEFIFCNDEQFISLFYKNTHPTYIQSSNLKNNFVEAIKSIYFGEKINLVEEKINDLFSIRIRKLNLKGMIYIEYAGMLAQGKITTINRISFIRRIKNLYWTYKQKKVSKDLVTLLDEK